MIASTIMPMGITAPAFAKSQFYDVQKGYWNQTCIEELTRRDIINGYPDGSFRPHFPVTRAQFATMVSKAFPDTSRVRNPILFADVPLFSWAYNPIREAFETGFLSGYPRRTFRPHRGISRAQVLVALASGLNYAPTQSAPTALQAYFNDANRIPHYARNGVTAAIERRLVVNYPNVRLLRPNISAKRADVASFLCQALANPEKGSLVPSQYVAGFSGVPYLPAKTSTAIDSLDR